MSRRLAIGIAVAGGCASVLLPVVAEDRTTTAPGLVSGGIDRALEVARSYVKGLEFGKFAELDNLFLPNERSTVSINGSDEGSWEKHRAHHLEPEFKEVGGFKLKVKSETAERFGDAFLVRQFGTLTIPPPTRGEEGQSSHVAVTYVLIVESDRPRIAHLHWSSHPEIQEHNVGVHRDEHALAPVPDPRETASGIGMSYLEALRLRRQR